jgi:hypothetical protein
MNNYHTVQLTGAAQADYIAQRFNQPEPAAGIVNTVDLYDFRRAFTDYNRANNFSYEGLNALFDWLEELAEDTGVPYELDVIALCCEFTEYKDLAEVQANYSSTKLDNIDDLQDHTAVIEFDGGLIIQDF